MYKRAFNECFLVCPVNGAYTFSLKPYPTEEKTLKKKILAFAVILSFVSIVAYGTQAFYVFESTAHNVITTGGLKLEIVEWQDIDGKIEPYPNEPITIMPGATVSKIVTVENHRADAYLRCRYECSVVDANGDPIELDSDTLKELIVITENHTDWTKSGDWFYYNSPLTKGDATQPLITKVYFPAENMTNEYQGAKLTVTIFASAVQVKHNGDSALNASGWPG